MPVENRLDMELTGIKTPVGIKVQGPDLNEIQRIGSEIEELLTRSKERARCLRSGSRRDFT